MIQISKLKGNKKQAKYDQKVITVLKIKTKTKANTKTTKTKKNIKTNLKACYVYVTTTTIQTLSLFVYSNSDLSEIVIYLNNFNQVKFYFI